MSSSWYPHFSTMKGTFLDFLLSSELKLLTNTERSVRKAVTAGAEARSGCAAIIQDGQGVKTEPIWQGSVSTDVQGGFRPHKTSFASIDEWFWSKPFPHECASWSIIHWIYEATDVIIHYAEFCVGKSSVLETTSRVTLKFQVFCRPALLKCHHICHDLTSTRTLSGINNNGLEDSQTSHILRYPSSYLWDRLLHYIGIHFPRWLP